MNTVNFAHELASQGADWDFRGYERLHNKSWRRKNARALRRRSARSAVAEGLRELAEARAERAND